jgi:predicted ATPase
LPDGDWRRERELDLQIALGQALIANRGWAAPELSDVHARARELASALNRPRALMFALWGQFRDHWARADLKGARRLAAELRELGDSTGDVPMQVIGYDASGFACFHLGEFIEGRAYLEEALGLYDRAHRPFYSELLSYDALVLLRMHSSWSLACLGHLDQAFFQSDAALAEAPRLSHPPTLGTALAAAWWTGWFVRLQPGLLLQHTDQLQALAAEHGLGQYRAICLIERGWCLAASGRADEGIRLVTVGLAGWDELGFLIWRPWALTVLADACRMAGQWQAALEHLGEAQRLAEETGDRWYQAETLRLTGDVLLAMSDPAAAEARYHEAVAIAQQQSAKLWELRASTSLVRLWRDQGKRAEAQALLAPVYNWFTEGFGTPVLQEAKALLDELADLSALSASGGSAAADAGAAGASAPHPTF